ncbi:MAG TPA: tail sheath stabilizer and completion protein, partial [Methanosarcina sp.]|nr:tail sheath stabilizer and completion protein [Methanosarcina sp.]
ANTSGVLGDDNSSYSPVPYNFTFKLYIVCKTQGDALSIVEQIIPYYGPSYTETVKMFPEVGISQDVPFTLVDVAMQDNYDGPFETKRTVTYVLTFVAKANLLGPVKQNGSTILHTRIKLTNGDTNKPIEEHHWDVNDDGSITGGWEDLY